MGRVLGKVAFGDDKPDRYFIHDSTIENSYAPLFARPADAWRIYDQDESAAAMFAAVPKRSTCISVIRKSLAFGRDFDVDGSIAGPAVFGLASDDRLLWPLHMSWYPDDQRCLLSVDGVIHFGVVVDGGYLGNSEKPFCVDRFDVDLKAEHLDFESMFGKMLNLCPRCVDKLLAL